MITVTILDDVDQLMKIWKRLLKLAKAYNASISSEWLLELVSDCMKHGKVFLVHGDAGLAGFCCVRELDRDTLVLQSLPRGDGQSLGTECLKFVEQWAANKGYKRLQVATPKFNGSACHYFKNVLKFRLAYVTYTKDL